MRAAVSMRQNLRSLAGVAGAYHLRHDGQRNFLRGAAAQIEPDGRMQAIQNCWCEARVQQALPAFGVGGRAAQRAHLKSRAGQRQQQAGVVQLGIMREQGDGGVGVDAQCCQRSIRPRCKQLVRMREAFGAAKRTPRIHHHGAVAQCVGQRTQRHGNVHAANNDERGRRRLRFTGLV